VTREPLWGALTIPEGSCVPISWDQGVELHHRKQVRMEPDEALHLCHPHAPGPRTNEDTNGLLWQYFQPGHRPVGAQRARPGLGYSPSSTSGHLPRGFPKPIEQDRTAHFGVVRLDPKIVPRTWVRGLD